MMRERGVSRKKVSERVNLLAGMLENDLRDDDHGELPEKCCRTEMHRLRVRIRENGKSGTEDFEGADYIRAGREQTSDIRFTSRFCSRSQFEIFTAEDGYYIRNLGRTNPTVIVRNGKKRVLTERPCLLQDGDMLCVGDVRIEVEILWEVRAWE